MISKTRYGLFIGIAAISLFFTLLIPSFAETINYIYDELNRLRRVEYEDGTIVEYTYDKAGNREQRTVTQVCECDLNHDGRCDMADWLLFGEDWGRTDCPI